MLALLGEDALLHNHPLLKPMWIYSILLHNYRQATDRGPLHLQHNPQSHLHQQNLFLFGQRLLPELFHNCHRKV